MKTHILYTLLVLMACAPLGAQDTLYFSRDSLRIKPSMVRLLEEPHKLHGVLYQLKDSSILYSNRIDFGDSQYRVTEISELYIKDIGSIYSNKGNRTILGALIGAGSGFVVGFITGYVSEKNRTADRDWFGTSPEFAGLGVGITFSLGGVLIGGIAGSHSARMPINGSQHEYDAHRERLHKYTVIKD